MFALDGRIAIVTGGSRGLGYAMTLALAEAGAHIFNVGRGEDQEIKAAVEAIGRRYVGYHADLSKPSKALSDQIVEAAVKEYGRVDILLNNAGANRRNPFVDYLEEDFDYLIELNLKGVYHMAQSVAVQMIKQGGYGKIINIASMLSFTGGILCAGYTASKSAVMGLTKAMANELSSHGINCNAIAPGYMATPLTKVMQEDPVRNKEVLDRIPMGHWGDPKDLMGPVVFLASQASDYVCGVTLPVDGGWLSR